jgi:Flp pilus assembly protein TadG
MRRAGREAAEVNKIEGIFCRVRKTISGRVPAVSASRARKCIAMSAGRITALISRFRRDTRANIAVIFAIATVPIITAVGCATDYSMAARMKTKLQSSADTASLASVSVNSAGWTAASHMTSNGAVPAGVTEANNLFNGNAATFSGYQNLSVNSTVTKTGATLTSVVTFAADVPVTFMRIAGWSTMHITGSSTSNYTMPLYLDFYLMLDVSSSMGLPSTSAEAVRMQNINPDNYVLYPTGCTLACHFAQPPLNQLNKSPCIDPSPNTPTGSTPTQKYPTGNYCLGYDISRVSQAAYAQLLQNHGGQLPSYKYTSKSSPPTQVAQPTAFYSTSAAFPHDPVLSPVSSCQTDGTDACIQLRLDAVGVAVNGLLASANDPKYLILPNQFRVGLYPYIKSLYSSYFPLTSSTNGNPNTPGTINFAAANLASLLDTNTNANLGSGGTDQDAALQAMNGLITSVGTGGASNNTLPYVFIVTDGAVTPQTKGVPWGNWSGSNHDTTIPIPDTNCTAMKNRGIIISILYIPFQPINPVNASFAGDEDDAANNNIPNIPASLQACASSGYYYTANAPSDITAALKKMFTQAVSQAALSR